MRSSYLYILSLIFSFLLLNANTIYAQFHVEKISDDAGFDFEKPVEFYAKPRYNRVEGLFVNGGFIFRPQSVEGLTANIEAGWGFWNESGKEFTFDAGIRKDFMDFNRLSIGLNVLRDTGTKDEWIVGNDENSLFSFFFREDYRDYYNIEEGRFYVDKKFAGNHNARVEVARRSYDDLQKNLNWSVFGGTFQENPSFAGAAVIPGSETALRLITIFDWRDNPIFPLNGWYLQSIYEHTTDDFDTDGIFLTLKRYQQTFGNQRLLLRGMLGSRSGSLAHQHTIDLGGIGSLRAHDDKEFSGNRMLMLNANYFFGGDILQKIPLHQVPVFGTLWTTLSLGVFLDTGWVGLADTKDGVLSGFSNISFESDVGLSVAVLDGIFRIDIARRTDSIPGKDDYRVTFRLLEDL